MNFVSRLFDSAVSSISPERAVKRALARRNLKRFSTGYTASKNSEIFRSMKASKGSADSVLEAGVDILRARSRHATRNIPTAKAGIEARVGIVVATGIDVEPNTGNPKHDALIKEFWLLYEDEVDAAGQLHFKELQRQAFRSEGTAGGYLFQIVVDDDPDRLLPIALHAFETDQLSPEPVADIPSEHKFSNGVETNRLGRPVFYHIIPHPSDDSIYFKSSRNKEGLRIPADEIIHGYEKLRPGQSTGEPIMAPALQRMIQGEDLVETELESAKNGSAFAVAIYSDLLDDGAFGMNEEPDDTSTDELGNDITKLAGGTIARLSRGDKAQVLENNRPSQAIKPFLQMTGGDIAACMQVSRVDLNKDYSEANYSSMRADMLDKKRLLTPVQIRFGRALVSRLYERVFPLILAKLDITAARQGFAYKKQMRHKLVPDGWAYVDPVKDIGAALMAIEGGLSTYQDEIGAKGKDHRSVHAQGEKEMNSPYIQYLRQYRIKNYSDEEESEKKKESNDENT